MPWKEEKRTVGKKKGATASGMQTEEWLTELN